MQSHDTSLLNMGMLHNVIHFFFYENQNLPQSEMLDLKISLHALHLLEFVAGVDNAVFLGLEFLFNKFRELVHQLSLHQSHNHYNYKLE